MKTSEAIEGYKTLAEFMGLSEQYIDARKFCWISGPNYSTDWNWLMPVVEKIESLEYDVEIGTTYVRIARSDDSGFGLDEWICAPKIEEVFNACVEFAKWYKNQPK